MSRSVLLLKNNPSFPAPFFLSRDKFLLSESLRRWEGKCPRMEDPVCPATCVLSGASHCSLSLWESKNGDAPEGLFPSVHVGCLGLVTALWITDIWVSEKVIRAVPPRRFVAVCPATCELSEACHCSLSLWESKNAGAPEGLLASVHLHVRCLLLVTALWVSETGRRAVPQKGWYCLFSQTWTVWG